MKHIITIDGIAGSGKNTLGELLAQKLHYIFIDTGYIYRAFTVVFLSLFPTMQKDEIAAFSHTREFFEQYIVHLTNMSVEFKAMHNEQHIFIDAIDYTNQLHIPLTTEYVPAIAAVKDVREVANEIQYMIAKQHDVVMAGRDIGTAVFPDAKVKFFITAADEVRAGRRMKQLEKLGTLTKEMTIAAIIQTLQQRDKEDSERENSPLKIPVHACMIDNSYGTPEKSVKKMIGYIREVMPEAM